ncbi:MAG: hypothetical protein DSZ32_01650 [Gammaproteobacteria bacterium]|nr:MAG: hypothetical protein DSZ32_01650 [Gammaproteobacteria bacterium]RTZ61764.1 MAG: hypothetical protein DSZ33_00425 [Gammaproteobacteria bacterium]
MYALLDRQISFAHAAVLLGKARLGLAKLLVIGFQRVAQSHQVIDLLLQTLQFIINQGSLPLYPKRGKPCRDKRLIHRRRNFPVPQDIRHTRPSGQPFRAICIGDTLAPFLLAANTLNDYQTLDSALRLADAPISAAEAHGIITGSLCVNQHDENGHWIRLILGTDDPQQLKVYGPLINQLVSTYTRARESLTDADFSHELLLPDDDASLRSRVEAMADWSRGFLLGLMKNGLKQPSSLPGDAGEFMQDLMAITEVTPDDDDDFEGQEKSLAELIEYVRIGIRLVYEELNPDRAAQAALTTH